VNFKVKILVAELSCDKTSLLLLLSHV
jgi:hypothetical protein